MQNVQEVKDRIAEEGKQSREVCPQRKLHFSRLR